MRQVIVCVVVVLAAWASGPRTGAQSVDLRANVDWVSSSAYPIMAGWAFPCGTSEMIDRVDVIANRRNEPPFVLESHFAKAVYRSDVRSAFASECPGMTFYSGWHVYALRGLPSGEWTVSAFIQSREDVVVQSRTITVP